MMTLPQFALITNPCLRHRIGTNVNDEGPTICVYSQSISSDCNWNKMQQRSRHHLCLQAKEIFEVEVD